ncbi:hypothetical protein LTR56_008776 [Elasticomyces elasticus]|nr:hypothetical protein LTR22_017561 [Elasticomyces elasticus]KAK3646158.1 hypothetical protein LTR56_008776 [Elasticomyces elasticus]KAK4924339.1 hypothetical protein LTR49_008640 [Elasticomyces elasticus]KAK5759103.1 hypothetical protein LTS12_010711 [Elasticomyces elasticus]
MQPTKGFLALPPELRNAIYEIIIEEHAGAKNKDTKPPALINVCRATRTEASALYYSTYPFTFSASATYAMARAYPFRRIVSKWLRAIGEENVKNIRVLRMELDGVVVEGGQVMCGPGPAMIELRVGSNAAGTRRVRRYLSGEGFGGVENKAIKRHCSLQREVESKAEDPATRLLERAVGSTRGVFVVVWEKVERT